MALPSTAASPPVTSAVLDNRSITGGQWIRTRFVPIVLGAVIVGALLGMARGAMNAVFFGIQGMLVGGGGGFLATRFGRSDPERFWSIGQRFWLGVGVMLAFTTANLVAASAAHAGPIDTPLYWLTEVVDGFIREPFLSVTRTGSASGAMTGTWWIIFTVVDAALLLFLFVGGSAAGLGDAKRPAAPESPARTSSARNAAVAVAVLIAAGAALYAYAPWRQQENPYSLENAKRIRLLAGQWKMDGGHGVFADTDEELRFSLKAVGYNTLVGVPAGGGRYRMSIDNQGDDYRGMLFPTRDGETAMPLYFRMGASPDASRLTMVFTVYGIGGRREVVITATRDRGGEPFRVVIARRQPRGKRPPFRGFERRPQLPQFVIGQHARRPEFLPRFLDMPQRPADERATVECPVLTHASASDAGASG